MFSGIGTECFRTQKADRRLREKELKAFSCNRMQIAQPLKTSSGKIEIAWWNEASVVVGGVMAGSRHHHTCASRRNLGEIMQMLELDSIQFGSTSTRSLNFSLRKVFSSPLFSTFSNITLCCAGGWGFICGSDRSIVGNAGDEMSFAVG